MGLIGRYTPDLVEEVARSAEAGPYKKAAEEACPKSRRNDMSKTLKYFKDNVDKTQYDKYIEDGLFTGSSPVESRRRMVIGARLKQSGMFLSLRYC
ncbi:MAG: hypothetical protein IJ444_01565 [Kiritimatiellae bacterium]|nr:hypothetical protein [Kiritimatiellia bacterium]